MSWLTAKDKNKPRLPSPPSLAIVAVGGVVGGAVLAQLDRLLQQQGQLPHLVLAAVPGLATGLAGAMLVAKLLLPSRRQSQQHWGPWDPIKAIP